MNITLITVIFVFSFFATFIQRVTGFGFGIVFMTAVPLFMPSYSEATALSGLLAMVCNLGAGLSVFRSLKWRKMVTILLTFLLFSYFAVVLVSRVDSALLQRILGAVLILVSIYFFFTGGKLRMKPTVPVQIGMGTVSGLMGGLFGMQGPPAVIYFISCASDKDEYMALTQWYFIIGNVAMTFFRAGSGFITTTVTTSFLYGLPAVLAGLYLGAKVYNKLPVGLIRKIIYVFIALAGLLILTV